MNSTCPEGFLLQTPAFTLANLNAIFLLQYVSILEESSSGKYSKPSKECLHSCSFNMWPHQVQNGYNTGNTNIIMECKLARWVLHGFLADCLCETCLSCWCFSNVIICECNGLCHSEGGLKRSTVVHAVEKESV